MPVSRLIYDTIEIKLVTDPTTRCTVLNINNIESVQRTFTKRLSGMRSLSYNGGLSVLGLGRLELRRIRADLPMCLKAHAFPVRIVSLWNRLPANIVLPANLKQFKMAIKNIDFLYALIGKD